MLGVRERSGVLWVSGTGPLVEWAPNAVLKPRRLCRRGMVRYARRSEGCFGANAPSLPFPQDASTATRARALTRKAECYRAGSAGIWGAITRQNYRNRGPSYVRQSVFSSVCRVCRVVNVYAGWANHDLPDNNIPAKRCPELACPIMGHVLRILMADDTGGLAAGSRIALAHTFPLFCLTIQILSKSPRRSRLICRPPPL